MLSRTLTRLVFRNTHHTKEFNPTEIIAKMQGLRQKIQEEEQEIEALKKSVKQKELDTNLKNNLLHEKRVKLTDDFKKAQKVWVDAKKKSEANKMAIIHQFAGTILMLGTHLTKTKELENETHSVDLREGFDNTSRLFFNTLEKFKITKIEMAEGIKVRRDQVVVTSEQKTEKPDLKDTVAKVVEDGWEIEGKAIVKPKVILYK